MVNNIFLIFVLSLSFVVFIDILSYKILENTILFWHAKIDFGNGNLWLRILHFLVYLKQLVEYRFTIF